jgi:hypothetical protein
MLLGGIVRPWLGHVAGALGVQIRPDLFNRRGQIHVHAQGPEHTADHAAGRGYLWSPGTCAFCSQPFTTQFLTLHQGFKPLHHPMHRDPLKLGQLDATAAFALALKGQGHQYGPQIRSGHDVKIGPQRGVGQPLRGGPARDAHRVRGMQPVTAQ